MIFVCLTASAGFSQERRVYRCDPGKTTGQPSMVRKQYEPCPPGQDVDERPRTTTSDGRDNIPLITGNRTHRDTRVIYLRTATQYPQLAAKRLQTAARVALQDDRLTVVTDEPNSERINFETVEFTTSTEFTDDRYKDNVLSAIIRDKIEGVGNRGRTSGRITEAILDTTGLSGQDITEYYYQEYSLSLGSNPLKYAGYAYFKVMARRDRYGAVTIRSLESMGDEESCWAPVSQELFPNFEGKLELLALDVALRQASFVTWIKGGAPHFDPPKDGPSRARKVGKCRTK